jgi:hypothetical protein
MTGNEGKEEGKNIDTELIQAGPLA